MITLLMFNVVQVIRDRKLVFWWPFLSLLGDIWVKFMAYQFPQLDRCSAGLLVLCSKWTLDAYLGFNPLMFGGALMWPKQYRYLEHAGWEVVIRIGLYLALGFLADKYIFKGRKLRTIAVGLLMIYWLYNYVVAAVLRLE